MASTKKLGGDDPRLPQAVVYLRVSTKEQAEMGGDPEGYSIPAQREACQRKAAALGAVIVEEFVDRGESARSANRPELQRLLAYVRAEQVDVVIVHKVDRLARSRADDVTINLALQAAGATLVSVTENIDETPSGLLLHGIMSSIAEFYSRNLANEVIKGSVQKAKSGGTPGAAPLGYLNSRQVQNGREVRTIELDEERAPLILWAFEAYATGEWTLRRLLEELTDRGLTSRAGPSRPAKPLVLSTLHNILRKPYYKGLVSYRGVTYPGKHPVLVEPELWQRVQDVLAAQNYAGEKTRVHPHYLKGTVFCGRCESRLIVTHAKGRWGTIYPYFICIGRQRHKLSCKQKAMLIESVEEYAAAEYERYQLSPEEAEAQRADLSAQLEAERGEVESERARAARKIQKLTDERHKLLQAHYAGAVPLDLMKSEQDRIARELEAAESRMTAAAMSWEQVERNLERCLAFITNMHQTYLDADSARRRLINQACFKRIKIKDDGEVEAELAEPFASLLETARIRASRSTSPDVPAQSPWAREGFWEPSTNKPHRPSGRQGLNVELLVRRQGLEPRTR
ncbi:MAG: recombinase family protein [Mycobacteriales bacterium]